MARSKRKLLAQLQRAVEDIDAGHVKIKGVPKPVVLGRLRARIAELEAEGVKPTQDHF